MDPKTDLTKDQKIAKQESELRTLQEGMIAVLSGTEGLESLGLNLVKANINKDYEIRALEAEKYVFILIKERNMDSSGTDFIENSRVIPVHAGSFDQLVKDGAFKIYHTCEVIHDPRDHRPKEYNLTDKKVSASATTADSKAIDRQVKQLEKDKKDLQNTYDQLEQNEKARQSKFDEVMKGFEQRQKDLEARELAIKNAEAAAAAATPKPAPVITPPAGEGSADLSGGPAGNEGKTKGTAETTAPKK